MQARHTEHEGDERVQDRQHLPGTVMLESGMYPCSDHTRTQRSPPRQEMARCSRTKSEGISLERHLDPRDEWLQAVRLAVQEAVAPKRLLCRVSNE